MTTKRTIRCAVMLGSALTPLLAQADSLFSGSPIFSNPAAILKLKPPISEKPVEAPVTPEPSGSVPQVLPMRIEIRSGGNNPFKAIEGAARGIGQAVEKGFGDAGKAIEKGAHDFGHSIETGVDDAGKAVEKGAHDGGHAVEKAVGDVGNGVEQGAHDIGKAVETAVSQTGHVVENAAHDVGHYAEQHPLEFALAVALVAGGGYLIIFQDFVFALQVGEASIPIIHGGAWTGGATMATGAGTLAYGASTPAMASGPGNQGTMETTIGRPTVTLPAQQPAATQPAGAQPPVRVSPPVLNVSPKLTEVDARLKYGMGVLDWIERERLVETFKPDDHLNRLSPAEEKLLDAIDEVGRIPDSAADAANRKQQEERKNLPNKLYKDAVIDLIKLKPPSEIVRKALTTLRDAALSETVVGDGQAAAREHQKRLLHEKLDAFLDKRFDLKRLSVIPTEMPPNGPVIKAN